MPLKYLVLYGVSGPSASKNFYVGTIKKLRVLRGFGVRGALERKKWHVEGVWTYFGKICRHDGAT